MEDSHNILDISENHYIVATVKTAHGELLIEVFPDGQVHVAERQHPHNSWSVGYWTLARKVQFL